MGLGGLAFIVWQQVKHRPAPPSPKPDVKLLRSEPLKKPPVDKAALRLGGQLVPEWARTRGGKVFEAMKPSAKEVAQAAPEGLPEKVREQLARLGRLTPLQSPIQGGHVSTQLSHMPGSRRPYRKGFHEGHDFYPNTSGRGIGYGSPVAAVGRGRVIRIWDEQHDGYKELDTSMREALLSKASWDTPGGLPPGDLDVLRGKQVWLDLGGGVVARYCHLSSVAEGLLLGEVVEAGTVLGFIGNSGTSNGAKQTQNDAHLHFELRLHESYLGEGLDQREAQLAFKAAFGELTVKQEREAAPAAEPEQRAVKPPERTVAPPAEDVRDTAPEPAEETIRDPFEDEEEPAPPSEEPAEETSSETMSPPEETNEP